MTKTIKFLTMMLIAAITMLSFSSCSKDDDEDGGGDVTGRWLFRESNILFYLDGAVYNLKEEEGTNTALLLGLNSAFGESFFIFADGALTVVKDNQTDPWGAYTVSGDKIIMNDGATTFTVRYRISGNSLDLTFNRSAFEAILGALPYDYYTFDEVEFILSFNRAN
jgi:hypothetical protein